MDPKIVPFYLVTLLIFGSSEGRVSRSMSPLKHERDGKFLFNIVQFNNDPCIITSGNITEEIGICYTSDECSKRGGVPRKSCAAGFGTCCFFLTSRSGEVDSPLAYYTNPSYPNSDNSTNYLTYTIKVSNPDVCQVRLDFLEFNISGPSLFAQPFGKCSQDRMAFFATQPNLGLSDGNLICGDMSGQHIYLPVNSTSGEDFIRVFSMVGVAFVNSATGVVAGQVLDYKWKIKIRQIDCKESDPLQAPPGCLQYYLDPVGTIESFNFRSFGGIYPVNLDYSICVKKQDGFGCFSLTTLTSGDEFKMNTNNLIRSVGYGPWCYRSMLNDTTAPGLYSTDYIGVMNGIVTAGTAYIQAYHVCGMFDGVQADFGDVFASYSGPVQIQFRSDDALRYNGAQGLPQTPLQAQQLAATGIENGFRLTYSFTNACPLIVV